MSTLALVAVALGIAFVMVLLWRMVEQRRGRAAVKTIESLAGMGPVVAGGRHPKIDPNRCIGSGACVAACPEKGVLAVVNGHGVLANPLACVGHGLCADACPMDAITLVYGSDKIAVELPQIDDRHETNQPGMYIVGELGGMGLIRNAVRQGSEAATNIAASGRRGGGEVHDAIVVGAGPAGITATLGLMEQGLKVLMLDREAIGGTILHYPRAKVVMTGTLDFPLYGKVRASTMSKEKLVELWRAIDEKVELPFQAGALVEQVALDGDMWAVFSTKGTYHAANVVLALGRRGSPRKLEVPGEEEREKVAYQLLEPEEFGGKHVLVVGGGNSAVESAISLAEAECCASVRISYRRNDFARCRGDNRARIGELIEAGRVTALFGTELTTIEDNTVRIRHQDGREEDVVNDAVIVQIGGTPPSALLSELGVRMIEKRGHE
jgi:thioredoxin reductase/NAD-dependent dihydropyrimidine dehydrogenase PreA subunit